MSIYKHVDRLPTAIAAGPRQFAGWLESVRAGDCRIAAHNAVLPAKARYQRLVLAWIVRTGGGTCDEFEATSGLSHQLVSPRFTELRDAAAIEDSGERRPTRSGRAATVWRVRK